MAPAMLAQTGRSTTPVITGDDIVKTYPNPATSYIIFEFIKPEKGLTLQVFSFLGRKMFETPNLQQKVTLDLAEYNRGLYMYQLIDATGKVVKSGKFQVSK